MRGCAILSEPGEVLAASGDAERMGRGRPRLLAAADAAGGEPVAHAHVATGDGEAFCVRESGLVAVAVAERFTLASLMLFDMRHTPRGSPPRPRGLGADRSRTALLLDRVSGYADEAAAYIRRRRHLRKPFARTYYPAVGRRAFPPTRRQGQALFLRRRAADRGRRARAPEPASERGTATLVDAELASSVLERALARRRRLRRALLRGATRLHALDRRVPGRAAAVGQRARRRDPGDRRGGDPLRARRRARGGRPVRAADGLAAALGGGAAEPVALRAASPPELQEIEVDPASVPAERKAEVLRELDERARSAGPEVAQVSASYSEGRRRVAVFNSEGLRRAMTAPGCGSARRSSRAENGAVETGFETLGAHRGFELLDGDPARIAEQAARKALDAARRRPGAGRGDDGGGRRRLRRRPLPRDDRPRAGGGRGPEGRQRLRGQDGREGGRATAQRLRRRHACRASGEPGRSTTRGRPCQRTAVIEEGKLTSYLYDRLRAARDGVDSTGNGRRESFRDLPIPRMTNTYIQPGDADPEEIIAEVDQRLLRRLLRRRPGRAGDRGLRLRRLRGLSDRGRQGDPALPRRNPDRQLPAGARRGSTPSAPTSR